MKILTPKQRIQTWIGAVIFFVLSVWTFYAGICRVDEYMTLGNDIIYSSAFLFELATSFYLLPFAFVMIYRLVTDRYVPKKILPILSKFWIYLALFLFLFRFAFNDYYIEKLQHLGYTECEDTPFGYTTATRYVKGSATCDYNPRDPRNHRW